MPTAAQPDCSIRGESRWLSVWVEQLWRDSNLGAEPSALLPPALLPIATLTALLLQLVLQLNTDSVDLLLFTLQVLNGLLLEGNKLFEPGLHVSLNH
ncbi:hypothetical protein EYF80_039193 [Liparis tanakae]|uniref:Uncharacterized protein n=1 Tax=Liparis tanakae TaxID=230148 RepID=A0A4Z2GB75_9TELE|nr:hypothetical protein EYF80_039193 [Liparis tanakae]